MKAYIARYHKFLRRNDCSYVPNNTPRSMLRKRLELLDGEFVERDDGYEFSLNSGRDVQGRFAYADGSHNDVLSELLLLVDGEDDDLARLLRELDFQPYKPNLIHKELYGIVGDDSLDIEP